jgi:hypothetical protein
MVLNDEERTKAVELSKVAILALPIGWILPSVKVIRGGQYPERPALLQEERVGVKVLSESVQNVLGKARGLAGDFATIVLERVRHASTLGAGPPLRAASAGRSRFAAADVVNLSAD